LYGKKNMKYRFNINIEGLFSFNLSAGINLRAGLRAEGVYLDGTCADGGTCGRCVVRVLDGNAGELSAAESRLIDEKAIAQGDRLACRVMPSSELFIKIDPEKILELDGTGRWKGVFNSPLWDQARFRPDYKGYGVAIDLGTTSIATALFDLATGRPLDIVSSANPQTPWGLEILSRLQAADKDAADAKRMRTALWDTVGKQLGKLCRRNGISRGQVNRAVVAGNSAMHHLALGLPVHSLLVPPFLPASTVEILVSDRDLQKASGLGPDTELIFTPLAGGFAGSDAIMAILAAQGASLDCGAMIDTGTNSEIAIWSGSRLLVATAAAGPAFEGGHIRFGMPANEGAIWKVSIRDTDVKCSVIGDGEPSGICGTGIVDSLAEMIRVNAVDSTGRMLPGSHPALTDDGFLLDRGSGVMVEPVDVETVQKAKAAIASTMELLLRKLDIRSQDLEGVFLAGAFGSRLDVENAVRIGLLPASVPKNRYILAGNLSLLGAAYVLLSDTARRESLDLAERVEHVNISEDQSFEDLFLENLFLPESGGS